MSYSYHLTDTGWSNQVDEYAENTLSISVITTNTITVKYHLKMTLSCETVNVGNTIVLNNLHLSSKCIKGLSSYLVSLDLLSHHSNKLESVLPVAEYNHSGMLTKSQFLADSVVFTSWMMSSSRLIKLLATANLSFINTFSDEFPEGDYHPSMVADSVKIISDASCYALNMLSQSMLKQHIALSSETVAIRTRFDASKLEDRIAIIEQRLDNLEFAITNSLI